MGDTIGPEVEPPALPSLPAPGEPVATVAAGATATGRWVPGGRAKGDVGPEGGEVAMVDHMKTLIYAWVILRYLVRAGSNLMSFEDLGSMIDPLVVRHG